MLTQNPTTTQTFSTTATTAVLWGTTVAANSIGSIGLVYAAGAYTNSTLTPLAIGVNYNLVWNISTTGITYINVAGTSYGVTQYSCNVFSNSATFLLGAGQSFTVYDQNSSTGAVLQTSSTIVITGLTVGPQGPTGAIGATGAKSFIIDHPLDRDSYLIHACLEGPEAGVYYRGRTAILDRTMTIRLPAYVETLAHQFTVHATAEIVDIMEEPSFIHVAVSAVRDSQFKLYASAPCIVNWLVFGKRRDVQLKVEAKKNEVVVYGDGPYKWM